MRRPAYGRPTPRLTWYRTVLCALDLHTGDWSYSSKNSCNQVRACPCGQQPTRTRHQWDNGWEKQGEVRICLRCGALETRGHAKILDGILNHLRAIGVECELAYARGGGAGRSTSSVTTSVTTGTIRRSPIHKVELLVYTNGEGTSYTTRYVIPDSWNIPEATLRSIRVRTFPVFGRVVDVRWEGKDTTGAKDRLTRDTDLRKSIIAASAEISVSTSPLYREWQMHRTGIDAPSRQMWECYETVARNLPKKA